LITVRAGVDSITVYYTGPNGRPAAEVFHFDEDGLIVRAYAYYAV
jgi:hypothetical protein